MGNKTVIVAGSSGLIGKEAVKQLIQDPSYKEIILLIRKSSGIKHPKIKEIHFDFSAPEYTLNSTEADSMLICIGTTMKIAKTKEFFKEVDLNIPIKLATLAKNLHISNVSVISAMGANPKSAFFYNRVKGEMENKLISMYLPNLTIVRPSLLMGDREEFRFGERFAEKLYKAFPVIYPKKYKPIEAERVAKVMIKSISTAHEEKVSIIENSMIHEISTNI
jgi:uncharacterized protein YbjT (DUF2867 family)